MVAAVGNNKFEPDAEFPARYREVIGISVIDSMKQAARFATNGKSLELVGPGVNITSCYPLNRYATGSGTSFACPHIVGAIALIQSKFKKDNGRKMTNTELRDFLIKHSLDLGVPGKDFVYGYGLFSFDN